MRLVVIQTGRVKDDHVLSLRAEYLKRFQRFGSLSVVEKEPRGVAPLWPAQVHWKVALDETGTACSSEEFAKLLRTWTMRHGTVGFLVGAAYGHHAPSLAGADHTLSLGRLTLPHQLAHLILIEQLYRCATILSGGAYHHG